MDNSLARSRIYVVKVKYVLGKMCNFHCPCYSALLG